MRLTAVIAFLLLAIPAPLLAQGRRGGNITGAQTAFILHGSVQLPDNAPLHHIVRIEKVCGGKTSGNSFIDSKGHFAIDLDVDFDPMTGQLRTRGNGATHGETASSLANCSLYTMLEGFRAKPVDLAPLVRGRQTSAPPIQLEMIAKNSSAVLSLTDGSAAPAAMKDFDRGLDLVAAGKFKDAIKAMEKASSEDPKFATAWLSLGMLQISQSDADHATKSLARAIEADDKFAPPYVELAVLEAEASNWDKVVEHTSKAIDLDPGSSPRAYFLNTSANIRLRKYDPALASSTQGLLTFTSSRPAPPRRPSSQTSPATSP